ncbi:MAG: putative bifunctional diguanylate cyclase/phosphodiesterase [Saccharospirillum sp.]
MRQPQDTLRYLRLSLLLRHSPILWLASAGLAVVCLVALGQQASVLSWMALAIPLIAWGFTGWGRFYLRDHPGFDPTLWLALLVVVNAVFWGMAARSGGVCMTLALAFAGMAGIALYAHFRLVLAAWLPVAVIPMTISGQVDWVTLLEIHLPLMVLILVGSWQGHRMALRNMERRVENQHLTELLSRHRDQLEQQVLRRTEELEMTNDQLNAEVELRRAVNQSLLKSEEQMNLAMAASGLGFWDWDLVAHRVHHSDRQRFFGQDTQQDDYFDVSEHIDPADLRQVRRALAAHLNGKTPLYQVRYRVRQRERDQVIWLEDSGKVIEWDEQRQPVRMIGTRRDITDFKRQEEELQLAASLFNNSPDGVFVLDGQQGFRTCNRVFSQIFGLQKSQLTGLPLFQVIRTEQGQRIAQGMHNNGRWQGDIVAIKRGHQRFPMSLTLTAIRDQDQGISHYLGICRDLSELKQHRMRLDYLSQHDALTGLFNRNTFYRLLSDFDQHDPLLPNQYAVAVCNLDNFRTINDRLGQAVGDQLLKDVAVRLNNLNDPVRQVARLGGDEFALLIDFEGDEAALSGALNQALAEISRPSLIDDHELIVTASCGVAMVHQDNRDQLLNQAGTALLSARQRGGNAFVIYRQNLASKPGLRETLLRDLPDAVAGDQFRLVYQPKLNLTRQTLDSAEALVRWHHPTEGDIDPEDFMPLIEEVGLSLTLDERVMRQVCEDLASWRARGLGATQVSVNLSPGTFYRPDLIECLEGALRMTGCQPSQLALEMTESTLMADLARAQDTLRRLHELGVHRALDDFGTGPSSLGYLKQFPLDCIKVDRSFLRESPGGESNPVVEAIVAMARSLKLGVVAEGVETEAQLSYLKRLGCDHAQGYLISRPMSSAELVPWLRQYPGHQPLDAPRQVH